MPVTAGLFGRFLGRGMSPEELAEKANRQRRDRFGRWIEERARLDLVDKPELNAPRRVVTPVPAEDIVPGDRISHQARDRMVDRVHQRLLSGVDMVKFRGRDIENDSPVGREGPILTTPADNLIDLVTMIDDPDLDEPGGGLSAELREALRVAKEVLPDNSEHFGMIPTPDGYLTARQRKRIALYDRVIADGEANGWVFSRMGSDAQQMLGRFSGLSPAQLREGLLTGREGIVRDEVAKARQARVNGEIGDMVPDEIVEADGSITPGPVAKAHLAALLTVAAAMDVDLERRIQSRQSEAQRPDASHATRGVQKAERKLAEAQEDLDKVVKKVEGDALKGYNRANPSADPFRDADRVREAAVGDGPRSEEARQIRDHMDQALHQSGWVQGAKVQRILAASKLAKASANLQQAQEEGTEALIPGSHAHGVIQREESQKMLAEIREMGGTLPLALPDRTAFNSHHVDQLEASLPAVAALYPAAWIEAMQEMTAKKGRPIPISVDTRGGFSPSKHELKLSEDLAPLPGGTFFRNGAHEIGHIMEMSMPQLVIAEWLLSHHRSPRGIEDPQHIYAPAPGERPEMGYFDEWANPYSGRDYGGIAYEIFTMGFESLMAESPYFVRDEALGGFDHQQRGYILALLALL